MDNNKKLTIIGIILVCIWIGFFYIAKMFKDSVFMKILIPAGAFLFLFICMQIQKHYDNTKKK